MKGKQVRDGVKEKKIESRFLVGGLLKVNSHVKNT